MPNIIRQGYGVDSRIATQGYQSAAGVLCFTGSVYQAGPTTLQFLVNDTTDFLGVDPAITVGANDTLAFDLLVELE